MNKNLERTFVIVKCLENVGSAWFFSTYVLFLASIGMDLFQATLINVVFMITSTVLDPLTGNLGDRIGQKRIYIAGLIAWAIGTGVYGFATCFWMCAVAEGISGIGRALRSEALESWLKNHTDDETSLRAMAISGYWGRLATIPLAILGGIVGAKWGLQWPWFLSDITCLLATGITWMQLRQFPEKPIGHIPADTDLNLWTIAKNAWADQTLRKVFVAAALLFACFQPFNMFWQLVFKTASGRSDWLGSVWMGIAIFSAIGSKLAHKWKVNSKTLALIIVSIALPMIATRLPGNWIWLILSPFMLHEIGRSMWEPVLWSYSNKRISDSTRTSVNSLRSAAGSTGSVIGLLVFGALTKWFQPTSVWAISATVLLFVALWVWRWNHDS